MTMKNYHEMANHVRANNRAKFLLTEENLKMQKEMSNIGETAFRDCLEKLFRDNLGIEFIEFRKFFDCQFDGVRTEYRLLDRDNCVIKMETELEDFDTFEYGSFDFLNGDSISRYNREMQLEIHPDNGKSYYS